jgi:hypothetical protein
MKIRRTKVTVVKEHIFVVAEHRSPIRIQCEKCGAQTRMVRLDEAAVQSGSLEEIRREVEASGLHYTEEETGALLVCFGPPQQTLLDRINVRRFF